MNSEGDIGVGGTPSETTAEPLGCVDGPPVLAACIEEPGAFAARAQGRVEATVVELDPTGSDLCFRTSITRVGNVPFDASGLRDDAEWIRVQSDMGEVFRVGVLAEGFRWSTELGESIVLEMFEEQPGFVPLEASFEVRGEGGRLVYWLGLSGSAAGLDVPPELVVEEADATCERTSVCIDRWEQRSVRVTSGATTERVGYGRSASLDALTFLHGGLDVQTGSTACPDGFVARAAAAAWPTALGP
ncbi:MAG: hypothetical protein AAF436_03450 [Myxococcota bacterium]